MLYVAYWAGNDVFAIDAQRFFSRVPRPRSSYPLARRGVGVGTTHFGLRGY
jgi:hypothetical protein